MSAEERPRNWVNDIMDIASVQARAYESTFEMLALLRQDPASPGWTYARDRLLATIDGTFKESR